MGTVNFDFEGETAIVTGGSSGIGRAIALRFGEAGANVVVADRTRDPKSGEGVPTDRAVDRRGGTGAYVETDVSNYDDLERAVERAREFGGVDVMVNNAGIQKPDDFRSVSRETFDDLYRVNVRGTFFGAQIAANDMIERSEPGSVVNVASISSEVAQYDQVPYDSTKGAIKMVTRGAALDLAEYGVRVNAVAPGQIATELVPGWTETARDAAASDDLVKPVPLGRAGTPEDCAGAVLFLASEAADYVTGELLFVDGGWTAI